MYFNHSFVIKNAKIQISENSDEMMQFKGLTTYDSSLFENLIWKAYLHIAEQFFYIYLQNPSIVLK